MTPAHALPGYRPEVRTDLSVRFARHGVSALAAAFAAGALVEDLVSPSVRLGTTRYDRGPDAVVVAVLVGAVILVALRDRLGVVAPLTAVTLFGLASLPAPAWVLDSAFVYLLVMLICGLGGYLTHSRLGHAVGLLVICAVGSLAAWRHPDHHWGQWAAVLAFMSIAWVAGAVVRGPVVRARSAEDRAVHLEQEQAEAARQAVIDERQRIARELHDIIAHSVSVMTLQAGAVRRRLAPDQTRERDSLVAVERTGREALAEMRRLVGMLRSEQGDALTPQPGIDDVPSLVVQMRAAGLPVQLRVDGQRSELPVGIDLSAYRIVQEGLTNALKHAGSTLVSVDLRYGPDALEIEISDSGGGGAPEMSGSGLGLVGIRERVAMYGGAFDAGRRAEGGFAIRVLLPVR